MMTIAGQLLAETEQRTARVLVVEDVQTARALAVEALVADGFEAVEAADGSTALALLQRDGVDVVLLDLGLPSVSGLDVLVTMREVSDLPVIIVSGRGEEGDRLQGLRLGADDYIVKPYSPRELTARVRSVLRRSRPAATHGVLRYTGLEIDIDARDVRRDGIVVELTPREFDLLAFLARSPRRAFSRSELLRAVWDSSAEWQVASTVTEHIRRLRHKLEDSPAEPRWVLTVRRVGYRFEP